MSAYTMVLLTLANAQDSADIFQWRNDPETRKYSFSSEEFSIESHSQWFHSKLQDTDCRMFVARSEGEKCGVIRLDYRPATNTEEEHALLSWTVSPAHRGKGLGKNMLQLITQRSANVLIAKIMENNLPSKKMAEACKYQLKNQHNGTFTYIYHPKITQSHCLNFSENSDIFNDAIPEQRFFFFR